MAQQVLQSELFAGQDWKVLYRAFTQANFNASDPTSIAAALRDYITNNYPEDFNDWIESSEFVAIIDLLAWLAGTIAFKTDINARENFLELAEARESILRLARFLSYNPRRCQPARGILKLVEVRTNEDLIDSTGANLNSVSVLWNNPEDPNWFERFTQIMNAAFVTTNPYGLPLKNGHVASIPTHLYRLNGTLTNSSLNFSASVNGDVMPFEICNGDFDDNGTFFERTPGANSALHLYHRNDAGGNGSPNSGFFFLFKQGTLGSNTFLISNPTPDTLIDIGSPNINDSDVWVQTVDDQNNVIIDWKKVPAIYSENITYNSFNASERNIFSVITRDNDQVSIRFADGIFGNAPIGNIKVWFRSSNGLQYSVRPSDMNRISIPFTYYNAKGGKSVLTLTMALQNTVSNAVGRETEDQIKRRAPSVFGTQNRMVSGEDYNVFPLSSNIIRKLKSINRTYSGHSRYIDLNDPTGTYQNTKVVSDDGMIYEESFNRYVEVPLSFNRTPDEILTLDIYPLLASEEVRYAAQRKLLANALDNLSYPVAANSTWHQTSAASASSTGYFSSVNQYYRVGAAVLFQYSVSNDVVTEWATIDKITGNASTPTPSGQRYGPVWLNATVPNNAGVSRIVPPFNSSLDTASINILKQRIIDRISFSLWYNPENGLWSVEDGEPLASSIHDSSRAPAFKVLSAFYSSAQIWQFNARGERLVFESEGTVKWYNDSSTIVDNETGAKKLDLIKITRINSDLRDTNFRGFKQDYNLNISKLIQYPNGYSEPNRIQVKITDSDADGQPDQPDLFRNVISASERLTRLFWRKPTSNSITGFVPYYGVTFYKHESDRIADAGFAFAAYQGDIVAYQQLGATPVTDNTFWVCNNGVWSIDTQRFRTAIGRGPNIAQRWVDTGTAVVTSQADRDSSRMWFQWTHYASSDHRIDPSPTNINDMFVLTEDYDFAIRQWITNGAIASDQPVAPTELDLRLTFNSYETFKVGSDALVWRPVKYKFLFGPGSDPTLRASFKIIKSPNPVLSDGEIKSSIISSINKFFSVDAWNFGDTFYATQMLAYLYQQLVGSVSSIELVPVFDEASFGDLQEIGCRSDELLISTAQVSDVQIISSNTPGNLRMR